MTPDELRRYCFGDEDANISNAYVAGFFEGAVDLFEEVKTSCEEDDICW